MDFNSRYKNADNNLNTIKTNAGSYDGFDDMDIMEEQSRQKHRQVSRASQARGSASRGRKSRKQMLVYAIIIAIEVIALVVIWVMYFSYNSKLKDNKASTESTSESNGGSIDVENDKFSLRCTKILITTDVNGSPVATVRFTFTNKTDTPLSMAQVFAPSFKQAGVDLPGTATLTEDAPELYNKDTQISNGESIECWYIAVLQDTTSDISITMHDNYELFADIGTTVVSISG